MAAIMRAIAIVTIGNRRLIGICKIRLIPSVLVLFISKSDLVSCAVSCRAPAAKKHKEHERQLNGTVVSILSSKCELRCGGINRRSSGSAMRKTMKESTAG